MNNSKQCAPGDALTAQFARVAGWRATGDAEQPWPKHSLWSAATRRRFLFHPNPATAVSRASHYIQPSGKRKRYRATALQTGFLVSSAHRRCLAAWSAATRRRFLSRPSPTVGRPSTGQYLFAPAGKRKRYQVTALLTPSPPDAHCSPPLLLRLGAIEKPIRGQVLTYNLRVPDLCENQDGTTSLFVCGAAKTRVSHRPVSENRGGGRS